MKRMVVTCSVVALAATLVLLGRPPTAAACGGFFCSRTPIDQAGENILYAMEDDGTLTVHVQILYQGAAPAFAWILPVPSIPEIEVGTDALFSALAARTGPQFTTDYRTTGTCRDQPVCERDERYYGGGYGDAGAAYADASAAPPDHGVTVHLEAAVGPYDAVVISSADADDLRTWLGDNDYDIPAAALPLLDSYVASLHYFVALKLQQDRGVGEIQPVVLRLHEEQPCLPIRLTAIAAVDDMPITAYFLGRHRAAPVNYLSVRPDLDRPELWLGGGASYQTLVSEAVDDAGGRAFVTEFAGAPPRISITMPSIDDLRDEQDPARFLRAIMNRGFAGDGQLLGILSRLLPAPSADEAQAFYNCLANEWCGCDGSPTGVDPDADGGGFGGGDRGCPYADHLAATDFDPAALVTALEDAIVSPRRDAEALLEAHGKLTRLFTTISPGEMTEDPVFIQTPALADVDNQHRAVQVTECSADYFAWAAPQRLELPSGRIHRISEGVPYRGSDARYCQDVQAGRFGPGVPAEIAQRTSAQREHEADRGGLCAVAVTPGRDDGDRGGEPWLLCATAAALWLRRRR